MFAVLFLLFTALPIAEIYILVKAGEVIGTWNTIALVLLSGFVGAWLVKSQARDVLKKLNTAVVQGALPPDALLVAFCILVGGVLMIAPGFITDVMGIFLVFPPTRFLVVKAFRYQMARMIKKGMARVSYYNGFKTQQRTWSYGQWPKPSSDAFSNVNFDDRPMKDVREVSEIHYTKDGLRKSSENQIES